MVSSKFFVYDESFMDTIIEIVGEFFELIIEFIEIKLYKRKNRDEDNDSNF